MFPLALFNDVGGGELIIVGVVGILLFGKEMPAMMRKFGRMYANFKKQLADASAEVQREMNDASQTVEEQKREVKETVGDLKVLDTPAGAQKPESKREVAIQSAIRNPQSAMPPPLSLDGPVPPSQNNGHAPAPKKPTALDVFDRGGVPPPSKIPPPV